MPSEGSDVDEFRFSTSSLSSNVRLRLIYHNPQCQINDKYHFLLTISTRLVRGIVESVPSCGDFAPTPQTKDLLWHEKYTFLTPPSVILSLCLSSKISRPIHSLGSWRHIAIPVCCYYPATPLPDLTYFLPWHNNLPLSTAFRNSRNSSQQRLTKCLNQITTSSSVKSSMSKARYAISHMISKSVCQPISGCTHYRRWKRYWPHGNPGPCCKRSKSLHSWPNWREARDRREDPWPGYCRRDHSHYCWHYVKERDFEVG